MCIEKLFVGALLAANFIFASAGCGVAGSAMQEPYNALSNPVLWLEHTRAELAFELAPSWMVHACNGVNFHRMWIFAQTSQQEGTYILAYGSIWVSEDVAAGQQPITDLQNDWDGEIDLIHKDHTCEFMWDPDYAFNGVFNTLPDHRPSLQQASIIHDLAVDLIRRELKIFGGRDRFFKALAATGHGIRDQDTVMIPLLEALKSGRQGG